MRRVHAAPRECEAPGAAAPEFGRAYDKTASKALTARARTAAGAGPQGRIPSWGSCVLLAVMASSTVHA